MKLVLGVNPASNNRVGGYGVVTIEIQPRLIAHDNFKLTKTSIFSASWKLDEIISKIGKHNEIKYMAIEDQYVDKNISSAIKLSRGSGRWEEAACNHNMECHFINPKTWQTSEIGGKKTNRTALKTLSRQKIKMLYNIDTKHFASDAILIARYFAIRLAFDQFSKHRSDGGQHGNNNKNRPLDSNQRNSEIDTNTNR